MQKSLKTEYALASAAELDLKKTFECGQCFRWSADESGQYTGVVRGKALTLREEDGRILCSAPDGDIPFWREYFDLGVDYDEMSKPFTDPSYLKKCADFGRGIRILRQDPWETLVSFIISQCNNIPRIRNIIATLCNRFGEEIAPGLFAFPPADALAALDEKDLSPLRCGYRAEYILCAARAVTNGELDFEVLPNLPSEAAFSEVRRIRGIGDKVANCFMLYGLHRMDRFPIDVWMKRALERHFPENYDPGVLGPYAGLAQQYIFYYARTNERSDNMGCLRETG
ncbi:MAG: DNA glycosylase [Oscillospiraceae bacterium]|nr:DNA glycosylase [Oscillospiraceae bacterium]